jgi:hypothetical protein
MSQQPAPYQGIPVKESNALGIAGFVCSLLGLFTGGLLSPIGLILSLVALGREPKGFAIAGTVIGLIGSCGVILALAFFGAVIVAMAAAALGIAVAAVVLSEPEKLEVTADMANIAAVIEEYKDANKYPPADLANLDLEPDWRTDPWGNDYVYHLQDDPPGYDLESAGKDGQFGTLDDVRLSTLDEMWSQNKFNIQVDELDDSGSVRITLGDKELIRATGNDNEGLVRINLGDRTLEIVGDNDRGTVRVVPTETPAPETQPE